MKSYYLVKDGEVNEVEDPRGIETGGEQALCYCRNESEALVLAEMFDAGMIQADNLAWWEGDGSTVVALSESVVPPSLRESYEALMANKANHCLDCGAEGSVRYQPHRHVWLCPSCWEADMAPGEDQ